MLFGTAMFLHIFGEAFSATVDLLARCRMSVMVSHNKDIISTNAGSAFVAPQT